MAARQARSRWLALMALPGLAMATESLPPAFLDWLAAEARLQKGFERAEERGEGEARSPSHEEFGAWLTWWQDETSGEKEMEEAER